MITDHCTNIKALVQYAACYNWDGSSFKQYLIILFQFGASFDKCAFNGPIGCGGYLGVLRYIESSRQWGWLTMFPKIDSWRKISTSMNETIFNDES